MVVTEEEEVKVVIAVAVVAVVVVVAVLVVTVAVTVVVTVKLIDTSWNICHHCVRYGTTYTAVNIRAHVRNHAQLYRVSFSELKDLKKT